MIVNSWTVSSLFLAGVSITLALVALGVAARSIAALRQRSEAGVSEVLEQRLHLLSLLLGVLALVRLLDWYLFYPLLDSYVPDLAVFGVMCAFGVTKIQPELVASIELLKPTVIVALGFWWLLARVDRKTETAPLLGLRYVLALPIAALALAESAALVVYACVEKAGKPITCCTQFLDTNASQFASSPSSSTFGIDPVIALAGYFGLHAAVVGLALHARRKDSPVLPFLLAVLALTNIVVTYRVWFEVIAPRVLELPYHHCVYELFTDTLALGPAAMLAVCGTGALLYPALLQPLQSRARQAVAAGQRTALGLGAVALASEALIVGVHLI